MEGGTSSKRRVEAHGDGESSGKRRNVSMGMDALDCPVCFHPLKPPIYQHKWPSTTIKYSEDVTFRLEPGLHFLRTKDRQIFLLNVVLEPVGHGISVVCIQPKATNFKFKCTVSYHSFSTSYYQISVYKIRSSSLSDGLPKGYNLILPKDEIADDGKGTLLTFSIDDPNPKAKVHEPICLKPVHGV
uniref:Uncharacterized protein n=1 Tax=Triticum aestivum TaxID=4565 RepID=A0A077RP74_WHEAT|nr:unnamed protein product [Triticum aestivum]